MSNICQSCSMPIEDDQVKGTNSDNSLNDEYCIFCYENGEFIEDRTLEEEIEHLIPMYIDNRPISADEARIKIRNILKDLKRWKK